VSGRIYSYLSGFDPEYAQKSVGSIIIGHAVQRAIDNGQEAFDFLQGHEPYKYTWGARDVPCFARTILKLGATASAHSVSRRERSVHPEPLD